MATAESVLPPLLSPCQVCASAVLTSSQAMRLPLRRSQQLLLQRPWCATGTKEKRVHSSKLV